MWASYITHPTPRSRITSLVRTSNANTHTEYDYFCHTDILNNDATAQNLTQSGVTIAFLTRDSSVSGLILPSCEFGSQISVVTPISIYAFCLSIQTVVQFAGTKVRNSFHITAIYDGLKAFLYENLTPNAHKQHRSDLLSKEKKKSVSPLIRLSYRC